MPPETSLGGEHGLPFPFPPLGGPPECPGIMDCYKTEGFIALITSEETEMQRQETTHT